MDPGVIAVSIPGVVVLSVAAVKIARMFAPQLPSPDVVARLEELEQRVQSLQQELSEAHERLDFTERVLAKAREERRIGG